MAPEYRHAPARTESMLLSVRLLSCQRRLAVHHSTHLNSSHDAVPARGICCAARSAQRSEKRAAACAEQTEWIVLDAWRSLNPVTVS